MLFGGLCAKIDNICKVRERIDHIKEFGEGSYDIEKNILG
jgi:hypothetical protein